MRGIVLYSNFVLHESDMDRWERLSEVGWEGGKSGVCVVNICFKDIIKKSCDKNEWTLE